MTLSRILNEDEDKWLVQERRALAELRVVLERLALTKADASSFDSSIRQLDEMFLVVVAGEFNAGKSAFINALLGQSLLHVGVTPTTERVTVLKHGETVSRSTEPSGLEIVGAPVHVLERIHIVDTPGTNAIQREHEALTRDFIPRSDMVLFVTSADRPFTESERSFLEGIRNWGKKIVVVVNKIDILGTTEEVDEVVSFVSENATKLLGTTPEVFPVSARLAAQAKEQGDETMLETSRFPALERFVVATLDDRERVRLKLLNPLGVGLALLERYAETVSSELGLLEDDRAMLDQVEAQQKVYTSDQIRDFELRLSDIDNALLDFESRGTAFFEETLRIGRIVDLINKAKVKADFERQVVADLPAVVEKRVEAAIDWMVEAELRQWKAVVQHVESRRAAHDDRIVGKVGSGFEQDRKRLLDTVGSVARSAIKTYDRETESTRLANSVQTAVAGAALLEAGAVGLGALVSIIATTTAADVTGILAAGAISVLGLLVLPAKKRRARAELSRRVAEVREQLMSSLRSQFERELEQSVVRIREAIGPYTRFVRSERDRLETAQVALEASRNELSRIESGVKAL
jgi:small GTP-binding protein